VVVGYPIDFFLEFLARAKSAPVVTRVLMGAGDRRLRIVTA
jgi:hypothetical protein